MLRSLQFIPANNPGMITSSMVLGADALIFDLEDAIAIAEKDAARILLELAYQNLDFAPCQTVIRINPIDTIFYQEDLELVKKLKPDYILLPKANHQAVTQLVSDLNETKINIIALIESAQGVIEINQILSASPLITGFLFGGEDYALDMQIERTKAGLEILVARQTLAIAARCFNKDAIDTPFTDIDDLEGLKQDTQTAKSFGFNAKAAINPRQIKTINQIFSPTQVEINNALEIIEASIQATKQGLGVFSFRGKMVDAPIINRAKLVIEKATKVGLI